MLRTKCFICLRKKIIIARFTNWPKKWRGVAIGRHILCTWRPQTCHLWKLTLCLYDVQLSSDFDMLETLHEQVNWPLALVIYGPGPDLWLLKFGP